MAEDRGGQRGGIGAIGAAVIQLAKEPADERACVQILHDEGRGGQAGGDGFLVKGDFDEVRAPAGGNIDAVNVQRRHEDDAVPRAHIHALIVDGDRALERLIERHLAIGVGVRWKGVHLARGDGQPAVGVLAREAAYRLHLLASFLKKRKLLMKKGNHFAGMRLIIIASS